QELLTEHATRAELLKDVQPPNRRHAMGKLLDADLDAARQRLSKAARLDAYRPAPAVQREWLEGRWVQNYDAHRRYVRRWVAGLRGGPPPYRKVTSFSVWPEVGS